MNIYFSVRLLRRNLFVRMFFIYLPFFCYFALHEVFWVFPPPQKKNTAPYHFHNCQSHWDSLGVTDLLFVLQLFLFVVWPAASDHIQRYYVLWLIEPLNNWKKELFVRTGWHIWMFAKCRLVPAWRHGPIIVNLKFIVNDKFIWRSICVFFRLSSWPFLRNVSREFSG